MSEKSLVSHHANPATDYPDIAKKSLHMIFMKNTPKSVVCKNGYRAEPKTGQCYYGSKARKPHD
jgi:hypothetical protein